jgi:hypothetical protein
MSEGILEKAVCEKCGVDVRENTLFCYSCGSRVADDGGGGKSKETGKANGTETEGVAETQAALDDLAERLKIDETKDDGKLAKAAAERKRARVRDRKTAEFVWRPRDDGSNRIVMLFASLITLIAAVVVFLTVFWK